MSDRPITPAIPTPVIDVQDFRMAFGDQVVIDDLSFDVRAGETFGLLGSNGSVIPLFKRQIDEGGPITITDKRIVRYFMTIPEAAQLPFFPDGRVCAAGAQHEAASGGLHFPDRPHDLRAGVRLTKGNQRIIVIACQDLIAHNVSCFFSK